MVADVGVTGIDPRPRNGNFGSSQPGQCRIVWTSDRLDSIVVGTAILVRVSGSGQILPCYVIAKLPERRDAAGRSHQAVARCGVIEGPRDPDEQAAQPEPAMSSVSHPPA